MRRENSTVFLLLIIAIALVAIAVQPIFTPSSGGTILGLSVLH